MSSTNSSDSSPLIQGSNRRSSREDSEGIFPTEHTTYPNKPDVKTRGVVWGTLSFIFIAALVILLFFQDLLRDSFYPWIGLLPGDETLAALAILDNAPVIVRLAVPPYLRLMATFC